MLLRSRPDLIDSTKVEIIKCWAHFFAAHRFELMLPVIFLALVLVALHLLFCLTHFLLEHVKEGALLQIRRHFCCFSGSRTFSALRTFNFRTNKWLCFNARFFLLFPLREGISSFSSFKLLHTAKFRNFFLLFGYFIDLFFDTKIWTQFRDLEWRKYAKHRTVDLNSRFVVVSWREMYNLSLQFNGKALANDSDDQWEYGRTSLQNATRATSGVLELGIGRANRSCSEVSLLKLTVFSEFHCVKYLESRMDRPDICYWYRLKESKISKKIIRWCVSHIGTCHVFPKINFLGAVSGLANGI